MGNFIKVTECRSRDQLFINLDAIAVIHIGTKSVLVNGVHGENTGWYSFYEHEFNTILYHLELHDELSKEDN